MRRVTVFTLRHLLLPLLVAMAARTAVAQIAPDDDQAAQPVNPPFGLEWGESAERIENLLKGAKADIVDRHPVGDGRDAWTVEGLIQTGLKRTVFYFRDDQLVEVELQYQDPSWDVAKYDDFMAQVRRRIEQKYGTGQLIARQREPEGDVMQTIVGYNWDESNTAIQLFYYSAETTTQSYRTVSVHYKWM